mmetsp:Transcript_27112/g.71315  ORF Transcript_27112/g.71315 Transcript_27112/m.71315 type:complete len:216 (+) Transcript_27112:1082-1729(+)
MTVATDMYPLCAGKPSCRCGPCGMPRDSCFARFSDSMRPRSGGPCRDQLLRVCFTGPMALLSRIHWLLKRQPHVESSCALDVIATLALASGTWACLTRTSGQILLLARCAAMISASSTDVLLESSVSRSGCTPLSTTCEVGWVCYGRSSLTTLPWCARSVLCRRQSRARSGRLQMCMMTAKTMYFQATTVSKFLIFRWQLSHGTPRSEMEGALQL